MIRVFRFMFAFFLVAASASAQFGHPLKGTWSGEWGPNRTHVVIDIGWDGKTLTSNLNPGSNAIPLKTTLDPSAWTVHFEGDSKDGHVVIDGKIENLGAYQRFITGTWTQGNQKGNFKLTRN